MTSKRPHDQRFWETDEWELCGWIEMTQMLLLYISAHLYVVFLKRMNEHSSICTLVQLHVCEWRTKPYPVCLCLPLYLIVWVLYFLMYLYPLRPVERLLAALYVCVRVCVRLCGCWLYSRLHSVRFCLWFSHSCSDGNKGLFIVWYTFFLNSLFFFF